VTGVRVRPPGHHGSVRFVTTIGIAAALAAVGGPITAAPSLAATPSPSPSPTPTCAATVAIESSGPGLALSPARSRVTSGDCVTFDNTTGATVMVVVGKPGTVWRTRLAPDGTDDYPAQTDGDHDVKASLWPLGAGAASGDLTVQPPASPSPSAAPSSGAGHSPSSSASPAGGHRGLRGASHGRKGSSAAGARKRARHRSRVAVPRLHIPAGATAAPYTVSHRGGGAEPKIARPGSGLLGTLLPSPSTAPSASPSWSIAATAPRVSPVGRSGPALGLAAGGLLALAIAALLAVGQLSALLRVLAAVDKQRHGVAAPPRVPTGTIAGC
jgi:plastocyanin